MNKKELITTTATNAIQATIKAADLNTKRESITFLF